jgi:hypothetical protein
LDGALWPQLAIEPPSVFLLVKDAANDAVVLAAEGVQSAQNAAGSGYTWVTHNLGSGAGAVAGAAGAGYHSAKELAASSYQRAAASASQRAADAAETVGEGYDQAAEAVGCSLSRAQVLWCTTTGWCNVEPACIDSIRFHHQHTDHAVVEAE